MPRPKLSISKSRAKTIRTKLGITARQLGDEAISLGISVNQLYLAKEKTYLQLKKGQTKNKREAQMFLKNFAEMAKPPVQTRQTRLGLSNIKKFFVVVNFVQKKKYINHPTWYADNLVAIYTITTSRNGLYKEVVQRLRDDYDLETPYEIMYYDKTKPIEIQIQRAEDFELPVNIRNTPVRKCGVLKYDFMPDIADISFKTTEMKCVIQTLYYRYGNCSRPISEKQIEYEMKYLYNFLYKDEERLVRLDASSASFGKTTKIAEMADDCITPMMIMEWCKKHNISCYMFDIKNKLFDKYVAKYRNYPPLVCYIADGHIYLVENKDIIESIRKRYAEGIQHRTQLGGEEYEVDDLSKLPIYDYENIENLELIEAPSVVIVNQCNLYEIFKELFKLGKVSNTSHKGEDSIKEIHYVRNDGLKVKILKDASFGNHLITYKDVMKVCKDINIPFNNQGIGSLVRSYYDKFRGNKSTRIQLDRKTFFHQNCSCVKCGSTKNLQIDHILPLANGGTNDEDNLQALCKECHFEKTKEEREDNLYMRVDEISSSFNEKVGKVFNSDLMKKWAFVEKFAEYESSSLASKYGYDICKCRKNNMYYSKYDWCVYSVMDDVTKFKGVVKCGFFFVVTDNYFPMRGNGWYSEPMIQYCLEQKFICMNDIKYQLIPSLKLDNDYFQDFIDDVYSKFGSLNKLAINALIGCFYRKEYKSISTTYTREFQEACYLFTQYAGSFVKYDDDIEAYSVMFSETMNNHETESPLYLQVLDMEAVEIHKLSKIVGNVSWVKTDCVYSDKKVDISKYEWAPGVPKYKNEEPNVMSIEMMPKYKRTDVFHNAKRNIKEITEDYVNNILHCKSVHIDGRAGTGKSYLINEVKAAFDEKDIKYVVLAPTNKAARNIGGKTIHKWLGNGKRLQKLKKVVSNIDAVIIDEISMMHEIFYKMLLSLKKVKPTLRFVLAGDFGQLAPVKDRAKFWYEGSRALYELCEGNTIHLKECKRADDILFKMCMDVNSVDVKKFGKKQCMMNICFTNEKRKAINKICMDKAVSGKKYIEVTKYGYDKNSQVMLITAGTPVIARINCGKYEIYNNEMFEVLTIGKNIVVSDGAEKKTIPMEEFNRLFHVAYCITVHKSQGDTIKEAYTIHEWHKMDERLKYVALSRATCKDNINIL